MNKKTTGVVFLVIGIVMLVLGFNEYGTFGSKAARAFGAGPSNKVLFLFIVGGGCTAFGLMKTLLK